MAGDVAEELREHFVLCVVVEVSDLDIVESAFKNSEGSVFETTNGAGGNEDLFEIAEGCDFYGSVVCLGFNFFGPDLVGQEYWQAEDVLFQDGFGLSSAKLAGGVEQIGECIDAVGLLWVEVSQ